MYGNSNVCGCHGFLDIKNKISPLTELKKLSEYVFLVH